jgi:hypothetical protein
LGLSFTIVLVFASAVILRSESRGTHDHILRSQIRDSPNLEGQAPVFISPRNRVPQLYPQTLGSLSIASYYSQGSLLHGVDSQLTLSLAYNISARTTKKHPVSSVACVTVAAGTCLPSRCPDSPISRSLRSNGNTRYSINTVSQHILKGTKVLQTTMGLALLLGVTAPIFLNLHTSRR